jgi:transcriptional regulator with XRE-family HTH domain
MTMDSDVDVSTRHLLITQRLRQRRDALGLTQKQVVTRLGRCGLHTTNRALSSLEHGTGLDVAKLPGLAAALECTITYLLGLTDDPHRWSPDENLAVPPRAKAGAGVAAPARLAVAETRPSVPRTGSLILGTDVPERRLGLR